MMLAAAHLPLAFTLPLAAVLVALLAWHWRRLGRAAVPDSRRRIRRASIVLMLMEIPSLLAGFSLIDGSVDPTRYVLVWTGAGIVLLLILTCVVLDVFNTLHLHARRVEDDAVDAAGELIQALEARNRAAASQTCAPARRDARMTEGPGP
jgi:hypothetical protein